jgi:hypothetical protein
MSFWSPIVPRVDRSAYHLSLSSLFVGEHMMAVRPAAATHRYDRFNVVFQTSAQRTQPPGSDLQTAVVLVLPNEPLSHDCTPLTSRRSCSTVLIRIGCAPGRFPGVLTAHHGLYRTPPNLSREIVTKFNESSQAACTAQCGGEQAALCICSDSG